MQLALIHTVSSLFAAQAGASRVIAVEASEKMATVAAEVNNLSSPSCHVAFPNLAVLSSLAASVLLSNFHCFNFRLLKTITFCGLEARMKLLISTMV